MTDTNRAATSEDLADAIIDGIRDQKGQEIVRVDLREMHNSISDYFVICHATSDRQVDAISDSVEKWVRGRLGDRPNTIEGKQNAEWVLMDYVDVVVHVFKEEVRRLYALEDLWADAPIEQIQD